MVIYFTAPRMASGWWTTCRRSICAACRSGDLRWTYMQGQGDNKLRPTVRRTFDPDRSAVLLDDLAADIQPDPHAAALRINLEKAVKDAGLVFVKYTDPLVRYGYRNAVLVR